MIFDRRYDESLWLMLYKDKENRERIAEFIKDIPRELYVKIQKSLDFYMNFYCKNDCNINEYVEFNLSGEVKTIGDMKYWYMINPQTGALDLGESLDDGEEEYDFFQMTLYPFDGQKVMGMESFDDILIGDIAYNYEEQYIGEQLYVSGCDSMEFHLVKLPFGKMAVNSFQSQYPYGKSRYNMIEMERIPSNYSVSDLSSGGKLNSLVKGRRWKKI